MANASSARKHLAILRLEIDKVLAQSRIGIHRSILVSRGIEVKTVRPYDPADTPSDIDYMVSARVSEEPELQPMSRVYYAEKEISVVALVDVGKTMSLIPQKQKHAEALFWLFALSAFKAHDRFRIIFFGDELLLDSEWIGDEDVLQEAVSRVVLYKNRQNMFRGHVLSYVAGLELRDAIIIMISDFASAWEGKAKLLTRFGFFERNIKMILFALDEWSDFRPHSYGMRLFDESSGRNTLEDMRRGGSLDKLAQAASAHFQTIKQNVQSLSIAFIRIPLLADPLRTAHKELMRLCII